MYLIHYASPGEASIYILRHPTVLNNTLSVELVQVFPQLPAPFSLFQSVPIELLAPSLDTVVWAWLISTDGPFPGGFLVEDAEYPYKSRQLELINQVKITRNNLRGGIAPTPYGPVDIDLDGRLNVSGGVMMANVLGADFNVDWTMADNTEVTLNATEMMTLGIAVGQYINFLQERKRTLTAALNAAATLEELEAIDITEGWAP